jgi:hypothetical protein
MSERTTHDEVGTRGFEAGVAIFLALLALLVIVDSLRVGTGWADDGPRSGYFPFYIGCGLLASSCWIIGKQIWRWRSDNPVFADRPALMQVVAVLVPIAVYVGAVVAIGIYAASILLISYFMKRHGRYGWGLTAAVSVGVPLVFFLIFERWFLVPLPKGPIERMLGF